MEVEFEHAVRSPLECDVIGDDYDVTTFWVLRGEKGKFPSHNASLQ